MFFAVERSILLLSAPASRFRHGAYILFALIMLVEHPLRDALYPHEPERPNKNFKRFIIANNGRTRLLYAKRLILER